MSWDSLNYRERWMVAAGALFSLLVLVYVFIWQPLSAAASQEQAKAQSQAQLLNWMQHADRRIALAKAQGVDLVSTQAPILLTAVETAFSQCHLSQAIQSVQQPSHNEVSLFLRNIPFDQSVDCLQNLAKREGIVPKQLTATATTTPGLVDLQVTLIQ